MANKSTREVSGAAEAAPVADTEVSQASLIDDGAEAVKPADATAEPEKVSADTSEKSESLLGEAEAEAVVVEAIHEVESVVTGVIKHIVADGKAIFDGKKHYGPGEEITFDDPEEAASMKAKGFLVNDATPKPDVGNGPTFTPASGPTIKAE